MSNSEDRFYGDMETIDVLEAGCVYLMMKKEYNVSRNSRVIWLLENLNKTITFVDRCNLDNCTEELTVISVIPLEQPAGWNYETSLKCKYLVTSNTSIFYLSHKYRIVYCLDVSPSLSAVDIQRGEVMIDEMFLALRHSLEGLVHSFKIPGSCATFDPQIYVTVIAHTPFFTTPAQQILVQGWEITNCNIEIFLKLVKQQLEQLEDVVAEVSGIAHDRQESVKAVSEEVAGEHFEEPNDIKQPQHENIPMVSPDLGFINMLRYGMLALRFLPDSGISNLVIITDGIIAIPDVHVFDSVLNQLRSATIACSFLHIGSLFHPHCCTGMVPYADLMHFISVATLGTYMNTIPDFDSGSQNDMNIYHTAFLTWSFHKNKPDMFMQCLNPEEIVTDWHVRNYSFYGSQDPQLHRKKQLEGTLNTSLSIFLYCRLKEGFCPKTINICDTSVEMRLVLPWKNHVNFEYYLKSPWPMNNAHTGSVHYCIYIEAPYSFLHDITCLSKKDFESAHRQAVVTRFWATFKNLSQSDKMIVQLNSFFTTPAVYVTPETVRNGMPVFYLNANSPISCSSDTSSNFIQYWRVLLLLDPNMWQKWLHTQSFGIILQHDRPLPKHLHLANTSGRFQTVQCRQAAAALYSLLKNWSSFVLVENQSYVKFISGSNEKPPTSYYVIHVASKPPYVLVNLQFLVGTPACIRHQVVQQVKETIGQLTFPQRPSVKEDHARKVSVGKRVYKHSPVSRTWSDINCCVMLRMPVEKILIRYERVPSDFTTVVFPDGTQPLMHGKHTMNCSGTSNSAALLTTLSRYLHHWRWVWSAQAGPNSSLGVPAIARVLSTITKIRLREGFNFAHSSSGIINMVLEVEMKGDEVNRGISVQNTHTCVVQYILFPPHITSVSNKDSSSEEGTDVVTNETNGDAELEGELKIITECWIEPQHGLAVNNPPERSYMDNLPYHKLADAVGRMLVILSLLQQVKLA